MTRSEIYIDFLDVLNINNRSADTDLIERFNKNLSRSMSRRMTDVMTLQGYKDINQTSAITDLLSITSLTEGLNGYQGEYTFPTNMLSLIHIEVSYDGITWVKAEPYSINDKDRSDHSNIPEGTSSNPRFRVGNGSFHLRPMPTETVSGGIRVVFQSRQPVYMGTVADEAAMLALTGTTTYPIKVGDWCWREDDASTYVLTDTDATDASNWTEQDFEPDIFEQNIHEIFVYDIARKEAEREPNQFSDMYETLILNQQEIKGRMDRIYDLKVAREDKIRVRIENFN